MTLEEFIASTPDTREQKRAITVKMRQEGYKHREIQTILGIGSSYISKWEQKYREQGVPGLRLAYQGSEGYLNSEQRAEIITWLQQKSQWELEEIIEHVAQEYGVMYRSRQSYYDLCHDAGMSWHQGRKKIPNKTPRWCKSTTTGLRIA